MRRLLPLLGQYGPHGSRSAMTCRYRCGDACSHPMPNTSDNQEMHEIIAHALRRRSVLKGGAAAAVTLALSGSASPAVATRNAGGSGLSALDFTPVEPNVADEVSVPAGYAYDVLIRWGDAVLPDAPRFDANEQSALAQQRQFGYNCDYIGVLPIVRHPWRAVMAVNHEYTNPELMFPADTYDDATKIEIEMAAHGMSIIEVQPAGRSGKWRTVNPRRATYNRRIHAHTPMELRGPARGDALLRTDADPDGTSVLGMLNNCAGGMTPWGTFLTGEENFHQYFDLNGDADSRYRESYDRYGVTGEDTRGWGAVDDRFELSRHPREPFRFGYIVEIDPYRPDAKPRKRTMLGRFKHEGATVAVNRERRVAVYMGDDERGEYIYKYVSREPFRPGMTGAEGDSLLDDGTLYVAKFTGDGLDDDEYDGTGEWLPLCTATESYVDGMTVAEVLINTRIAADAVGATKMDRPEDIEPNPVTGRVYAALTNNDDRGSEFPVDEANPLDASNVRESLDAPLSEAAGNRNGYVLEWAEDGGDAAATTFSWNLFLVCGDPNAPETYFGGFPKDQVSPISCPDNVTFDRAGNLWISTDGNALGSNDGLFAVPTRGSERGNVAQFLTVPPGAETCGPLLSADERTVFAAVQHPGEADGASFENPASTWPHTDEFPRPSVICAYRVGRGR